MPVPLYGHNQQLYVNQHGLGLVLTPIVALDRSTTRSDSKSRNVLQLSCLGVVKLRLRLCSTLIAPHQLMIVSPSWMMAALQRNGDAFLWLAMNADAERSNATRTYHNVGIVACETRW